MSLKGSPDECIETLMNSFSSSTIKQYSTSLKSWRIFCLENNFEIFDGDPSHVLKFLQSQLEAGSSYSTLNTARSALSLILPSINGVSVGENPTIKRFLKASFRVCPKTFKYKSTWDPEPVLKYLSTLFPLEDLSLEKLTLKFVGLLALATAHRVQTFSLIELENIHEREDGIDVFISKLVKTSAPGRNQPCLFLPFLREIPELCVASSLLEYRRRTQDLRTDSCNNFLISFVKPHKAVTSQTISRWIKIVLKNGGIDTDIFSAHSTRHASTSSASKKGVSLEEIRQVAGWSQSSSVFARFYHRPTSKESNFAKTVLS